MKRMPIALLFLVVVIAGCSDKDNLFRRIENPTPIHDDALLPAPVSAQARQQQTPVIEAIPVEAYLAAMRGAYDNPDDPAKVSGYIEAGLAVSDAYCTRWFRRLDEAQRRITFAQNNFNVVRQLGTALIGVAKLSSDVTTVYGAVNTAIEGVNANINETLFLAPDTAVIKRRVTEAMASRADQLRSDQKPVSFVAAYVQLERYADMCSFVSARQYVNQAIASPNGEATADPATGEITLLRGAATGFQVKNAASVVQLQDAVDALSDNRAIALAANPPVPAIPGFGANLDQQTGDGARSYLKRLLTLTSGDADSLTKWQAALAQ